MVTFTVNHAMVTRASLLLFALIIGVGGKGLYKYIGRASLYGQPVDNERFSHRTQTQDRAKRSRKEHLQEIPEDRDYHLARGG